MSQNRGLMEKELDELYKKVAAGEKRGSRVGLLRRVLAYGLKAVAAGGSLVVATGEWPELHQACGISVLIAVFLDTISSNHKRLLAEVKAGYAYQALRHRVKTEYNRKFAPLMEKKASDGQESKSAEEAIARLQQRYHKILADNIADIRAKLAQVDIDALTALSLDHERAAAGAKK